MERAFEQWKSKEVARLLALVETERRYYQELVASLPVSVAVLNTECNLMTANRMFRQNFGVHGDDLRKRCIDQILPSAELQASIHSVFESGIGSRPIVIERAVSGSSIPRRWRVSIQGIRDWDEDSGLQALLVAEDMGDESVAPATILDEGAAPVAAVPKTEGPPIEPVASVIGPGTAATQVAPPAAAWHPALPDPLPCIIWTARAADRIFLGVSPSAKALLGVAPDDWIGKPQAFAARIAADDRAPTIAFYDQTLAKPGFHSAEFRMLKPGAWFRETILVEAGSDTITGVITDITTRRAIEEQVLQSQRLDAISTIAGRIAHDINNPLMIVNGYAEDLAQAFPPGDPRTSDMREIQAAGKRIGELTAHLQAVTRRQAVASSPVDVATELSKVVERMRATAGEYLQADYKPSAQSLSVLADAGQLAAVLLELAAALVEGGGESAHLVLSANPIRVTDLARPDQPLAPGSYVEICIVNNSEGVPNLPARMFESLLPAKDSSRESGPALAKSFRTVQEWGGTIQRVANSNEIRVYLKAAASPQPPAPTPPNVPKPSAESAGKSVPVPAAPARPKKPVELEPKTRILVVEDEPGIRALMRKILERERFEVYEAGTGAEALEILQQKGPVNLLITDVLMPGMTGRELATEVQALDPHCGILYMSGFTADTGVETGQFPPGSFFLQKPFTLGSLLRKANEVIAATPRRRPAS